MSCEQLRILKCCKAGYSESYDLVTIMMMVEVEMVMMRMMMKKRRIRC